ncbi:MAG TPA: hypothetical protein VFN43_04685, partial [Humibacillus sp.]|nr:hypothetical protein [Humibacillus sp.]
LDPSALDDAAFDGLLALAGLSGGGASDAGAAGDSWGNGSGITLPERMAPLNALLDALPPALREALLLGVIDRLARPTPAG